MGDSIRLRFDELPVWEGVQKEPIFSTAPLELISDGKGYIHQPSAMRTIRKFVERYARQEYMFITNPPGCSPWSSRLGNVSIEYTEHVYSNFQDHNILEIGAGSLFIAEYFAQKYRPAKYTVIDPALRDTVEGNAGIEVIRNYFSEDLLTDSYDLALSFNTLEHVADPKRFLLDIGNILTSVTGRAVLIFPDIERQFQIGDLNAILHEHLNYFTHASAVQLLLASGFEVLDSESKNGSLFFFVKPVHERRKQVHDVDTGLLRNASLIFRRNSERALRKVRAELARGKKVAFHGACNGLNNFLYLAGIKDGGRPIQVFDTDDAKTGTFLPVFPKSICAADDPRYAQFDLVCVAALTYYAEIEKYIMKRHGFTKKQVFPLAW